MNQPIPKTSMLKPPSFAWHSCRVAGLALSPSKGYRDLWLSLDQMPQAKMALTAIETVRQKQVLSAAYLLSVIYPQSG